MSHCDCTFLTVSLYSPAVSDGGVSQPSVLCGGMLPRRQPASWPSPVVSASHWPDWRKAGEASLTVGPFILSPTNNGRQTTIQDHVLSESHHHWQRDVTGDNTCPWPQNWNFQPWTQCISWLWLPSIARNKLWIICIVISICLFVMSIYWPLPLCIWTEYFGLLYTYTGKMYGADFIIFYRAILMRERERENDAGKWLLG